MNKLHVVPNQINTGQSTSIQKRERNCPFPSRESVVTETVQCRTRTPLVPPRLPPLTGGQPAGERWWAPKRLTGASAPAVQARRSHDSHPRLSGFESRRDANARDGAQLSESFTACLVSPTLCETFKVSGSQLCLSSQMWAD